MSSVERDKFRDAGKVAREGLRTFNRELAPNEEAQRERAASGAAAHRQAAVAALFSSGAGVDTLEVEEEPRDFDAERAEWQARIKAATDGLGRAAVEDAPEVMADAQAAVELFRRALDALGELVLKGFFDALATVEPMEEALAEVEALKRDFRGDSRVVGAQHAAVKRFLRGLLEDASQSEVAGLICFDVLNWARQASPLERTWTDNGIPILKGSVLTGPPSIRMCSGQEHRLPL